MKKVHFDLLPDTDQLSLLLSEAKELITIPFGFRQTATLYIIYDYFVEVYRNENSFEIIKIETLQKENERFNLSLYCLYVSVNDDIVRFSKEEKKPPMIVCSNCEYGWYMKSDAKMSDLRVCSMCNKNVFKFRTPSNFHLSFKR